MWIAVIDTLILALLAWGVVRLVKVRPPLPRRCGACAYEAVEDGELCPECGGAYASVGVLPARSGVQRPWFITALGLAAVMATLGVMAFPFAVRLVPWRLMHLTGSAGYDYWDSDTGARSLALTYDIDYVSRGPALGGTIEVIVKGNGGRTARVKVNAAGLHVREVEGAAIARGSPLTEQGVHALYEGAGLPPVTPEYDAGALYAQLAAQVAMPDSIGSFSGPASTAPASASTSGGAFSRSGGYPVVPAFGSAWPFAAVFALVIAAIGLPLVGWVLALHAQNRGANVTPA